MRAMALLAVLLWQAASAKEPPVAQPSTMRYERAIRATGAGHVGAGQACATLDAAIFPHAAASLTDLRIFPVGAAAGAVHEVPYAITMSEAASEETESARVVNLGARGDKIVFDLAMPQRAYSGVTLLLDPTVHDFLATAVVTGADAVLRRRAGQTVPAATVADLERARADALYGLERFAVTARELDASLPQLVESARATLPFFFRLASKKLRWSRLRW